MAFQFERAEAAARDIRSRLWKGESAIKALKWIEGVPEKEFKINTNYGSAVDGHKEAMDFLNNVLSRHIGELVSVAISDMIDAAESSLGPEVDK